jgi:arsenate reductase
MNSKKRILFLCTHNAARSQMAEGFVNARYGDRFDAYSAGIAPTGLHRCAVKVMAEEDIDISAHRSKSVDEFSGSAFDCVVTMCADAAENCPIFPAGVNYLHHPFDNPTEFGAESCASFRHVRDQIKQWVELTFGHND